MAALAATAALALDLAQPSSTRAQSCATVNLGTISESGSVVREGRLAVGDCASNISFRLADVYLFRLTRTAAVRIGMDQTGSVYGDPELFLLNTDGSQIARNDDGGPGRSALIGWRLDAGTYRVEAATRNAGGTFTYNLSISVAYTHIAGATDPAQPDESDLGDPTDDGQMVDGSSRTTTVSGRVIARIHDRTAADGQDDYAIEFGFLPEWAVPNQDWSTEALAGVLEDYGHLLPNSRWLNKATIEARALRNNQNWLRSDPPVVIPFSASGAGGDGLMAGDDTSGVEGRIIVRYQPRSGALRIQFGFVPERAFRDNAGDVQAAINRGRVLPEQGFLHQRHLTGNRGIWFRSSVIEISSTGNGGCPRELEITGVPREIEIARGNRVDPPIPIGTVDCPLSTQLSPISVTGLPSGLRWETRDAGAGITRIVITGSTSVSPRSYPVTIVVRGQDGDEATARTTIQVGGPPPPPPTQWRGYDPSSTNVGGQVRLIQPDVIQGPSRPAWSYSSATTSICTVDAMRGTLTLIAEGECEVIATLAADLPRWAETRETATVSVTTSTVCITWAGYNPASMTVGGSSPTLLRPSATDCRTNSPLSPRFTFALDNPSTDVCQVSSSGRITALREGTCTIVATSAPSGNYGSATSSPRSVTISAKMPPCLERVRYDAGSVRVNASLDSPEPSPLPSCLTSQMTYETTNSTICNVDSRTGRLTGSAEGTCRITITSPETSTLRADSATRQITVSSKIPPDCNLSYAGNVNVNATARANFSCRPPGGMPTFRADDTTICSVNSSGDVTGLAQGTCSIVVNVAETGTTAATTARAQLTVVSIPTCTTIGNREFSGSQSSVQIDLDRYCRSADNYAATSSNRNVATHSLSGSQLTLRPGGSEGSSTIQVTATNRGGSTTTSFTVTRRTERPVISISCSPSSPMVNESVTCTYRLISGNEPTSFDWRGGASSGSSMRYTTSFSTHGSKTISLTASNAGGSGSDSIMVTVPPPPTPPNRSPICDDDPHDVDIDEGDERSFQLRDYCFDPDRDEVTPRTSSSNSRVAIADSDRRGWKFVGQGHGTATITITATDPGGLSDSARVTVNVRGGPDCYDIPDTVLTTINAARQTIALSRYCRHPSGGSLTYSASTDNTRVARVSVSGSTLTISPGSTTGVANVSVTVSGSGLRTRDLNTWFEIVVNPHEPKPTPPPSGYGLARCGDDNVKVYYFEYTARDHRQWSKHHLDMSWESAVSIWSRRGMTWGENLIDELSQSQCDEWTTGSRYTASTSFTPRSR